MEKDMKEIIADAARRLIEEKNVKRLTVKDIVEEGNITRQTFYYHFDDIPSMFRWILTQKGEQLVQEALTQKDAEQGLRFFFQMALNVAPYTKRGLQTNYADELQQLLFGFCYKFFEQIVERENMYPNSSRSDVKLFLRYHSYAIVGILQNWTEEDTQNMDKIVHKLHLLINGAIVPQESER